MYSGKLQTRLAIEPGLKPRLNGFERIVTLPKRVVTISLALGALLTVACNSEETPAPSPTVAPVASAIDFKVGNNIGDRIPEFEIVLTDGTPITSAGLLENGRPAFLFFFATT